MPDHARPPFAAQSRPDAFWGLDRRDFAPEVLRILSAHGQRRAPKTILTLEGENAPEIFLVRSGWLAVSKSLENGQRQLLDVVLPGEVIDSGSADHSVSTMQVEALSDVRFSAIPKGAWSRLLDDNADVRRAYARQRSATISRMGERMLRLGKGSAESRIAYAIIELCVRSRETACCTCGDLHIPMTQQQLGDFTGLSAVHICRTLRRLQGAGILSVTEHMKIVIHDMDALAKSAGIDPASLQQQIVPAA
jgi:CRP-like cAMP-binding protein